MSGVPLARNQTPITNTIAAATTNHLRFHPDPSHSPTHQRTAPLLLTRQRITLTHSPRARAYKHTSRSARPLGRRCVSDTINRCSRTCPWTATWRQQGGMTGATSAAVVPTREQTAAQTPSAGARLLSTQRPKAMGRAPRLLGWRSACDGRASSHQSKLQASHQRLCCEGGCHKLFHSISCSSVASSQVSYTSSYALK